MMVTEIEVCNDLITSFFRRSCVANVRYRGIETFLFIETENAT